MMKYKVLLLSALVLIVSLGVAQPYKKTLKQAVKMYEYKDYKGAIPLFLEVLKQDKTNIEANFKLGHCYLNTTFNHYAEKYLVLAYTYNRDYDPEIRRDVAYSKQLNHKFEEAIEFYELEKTILDPKKNPELIEDVDKHIEECKNGIELMKNPVKVDIINVGNKINSIYPDYVPVITADRSVMVFTSRRPGNIGEMEFDENGNEVFKYEDIYMSFLEGDKWGTPQNIGKPVNGEFHDANVSISSDGSILFIYKAEEGNGDLFSSKLEGEKWTKPESLGKNVNSKYYEPSCSMTSDESKLYFSSDRPGGYGGLDIWVSKKEKNGKWGEAVNLGSEVNTKYDDDAPFIHPDGKTLYFSSKGHKTMGGYDIFTTIVSEDGTYSKPENIGYPINTADDDIYFVVSADKKHGYYASAREGTYGEKDIYEISIPEEKPKKDEPKKVVNPITMLKGVITDALTGKPVEAKIFITDNTKNQIVSEMHSNASTGKYLVILPSGKNYGIAVQNPDYLFHSENFDIPSSTDYQEVEKNVQLKKMAIGTKIVLRNIFFDFDKATLRPESTAELERLIKLLTDLPNLKIEISGHTDDKGSDEYNKKLSERRAETVVNYLIEKGIASSRLQFAGYGEERPIDTNETDEGRQQNRRTEFEIIGN